ncbi:MAG: FAD-dependent oxidoreductase [Clostridiales bacterium]|jgi:glycerol-3-phosphate dehydrogenase|nr:FAD-dependent oxidoreductase [Clostridiales bacterium]
MYDVAIVGAGVIGASVARELSRYAIKAVVLEKDSDVAMGSSKANSGLVHAGYDPVPGTLKAKYNMLGRQMFDELASQLDFPFKQNGALVIIKNEADLPALERLMVRGVTNGLRNLRIVRNNELHDLEPNLHSDACAAMLAPSAGITSPYEMVIALCENAAQNGTEFMLDCRVEGVSKEEDHFCIQTTRGIVKARIVVNAAGVHSDEINNMLSAHKMTIVPRRGEYCLLDKSEGAMVKHTIFQLPTKMGKGVLVTPTADGNLLLGPTSHDIDDKDDVSTTKDGLDEVLTQSATLLKHLPTSKIITSFSGLRSWHEEDEFIIEEAPDVPGLVNLCGIDSPGLTAAPAIGLTAAEMVVKRLGAVKKDDFEPNRKGIRPFQSMTAEQRKAAIAENPDYGQIICRCESVSKAEIIAALRSPLGVNSLDAIKRRTRAGMGRCQGGFCWMRLLHIVADECGINLMEVTKSGGQSNVLVNPNKSGFAKHTGGPADEKS